MALFTTTAAPDNLGVKWDVVRALQSTMNHYLTQLRKSMEYQVSGGNGEWEFQEVCPLPDATLWRDGAS